MIPEKEDIVLALRDLYNHVGFQWVLDYIRGRQEMIHKALINHNPLEEAYQIIALQEEYKAYRKLLNAIEHEINKASKEE